LDLSIGNPGRLETLEPILTEADHAATSRDAGHASAHLLPVLNFLRHQHDVLLVSYACAACAFLWLLVVRPWSSTVTALFTLAARARAAFTFADARFVDRIG